MNNIFKEVFLETDRLIIRNIAQEDKKDFFEIYQDPSLCESNLVDRSMEEISKIIDRYIEHYDINTLENIPIFNLAIILKNEQKLIGEIGISNNPKNKIKNEIFILINLNYRNKGYASEATNLFLDYIKNHNIVSSLFAKINSKNIISSKILLKSGFNKKESFNIEDKYKMDIYEPNII